MSFSVSKNLASFLEEEYYKREHYKDNIYNILYKNNILDSSLISQSNRKMTDIKLVKCGDYLQFYFFPKNTYFTDKNMEKINKLYIPRTSNKKSDNVVLREIETKNITRSKLQLQNLIKANEKEFKTFITLTFEENITDVKDANKKFNVWRRNLKRIKPNFKYVCVPEFQKRGAVHYHLMTNIEYQDTKLLLTERKIWNKSSGWQIGKDVKGWCYGHSMAKDMKTINLVGYITKYMTKDIDNRLFSQHRYFYSQNLEQPEVHLLDMSKFQDKSLFELLQINYEFKEMTYSKKYHDKFGDDVVFIEYKIESEV